ncbi:MAG: hypothetical protein M9939_02510 [Mesorhizobium sp.]|nr:hypothetical protein [Mesorhizobium sp.]MCO5159982.1 hypothetical protein [Mesorhizobium sp.]
MSAALKLAAVVAANLVIWPAAWAVFERPAGSGAIATPRDASRAKGSLAAQPELGEVLDFSQMSPVQAYSRPLFERSRRPWQPPELPELPAEPVVAVAEEPEVQALPAPTIRLVGVSSSGAADIKALVQLDETPEPVWVLVGDVLQGWKVAEIGAESITILRGKQFMSFDLYPEVSSGQ